MKDKISTVVLTHNSQHKIKQCLDSILWCDEIIVIDDFSDDKTLSIIRDLTIKQSNNLTVRIFQHHLNNDFAAQRNFGLTKAAFPWVLFIDSDETVSQDLAEEITKKISGNSQIRGYYLKRLDYFAGRWLKYGETGDIKLLRLGMKDKGRWVGPVHEVWQISEKTGVLANHLNHYPHESVSVFLDSINYYSDLVVSDWIKSKRQIYPMEIVTYPFLKFIRNYILRLGFLDGTAGFISAVMMSFHSFLARGKYWLSVYGKSAIRR